MNRILKYSVFSLLFLFAAGCEEESQSRKEKLANKIVEIEEAKEMAAEIIEEKGDGQQDRKDSSERLHSKAPTGLAMHVNGTSFAIAEQAFFAAFSSVKIPKTEEPVPVITAPSAPLLISLFFISAMVFIRLSGTSSNTLYILLQICARFPSWIASRIPAVSGWMRSFSLSIARKSSGVEME